MHKRYARARVPSDTSYFGDDEVVVGGSSR